jgi:hypothetical protein
MDILDHIKIKGSLLNHTAYNRLKISVIDTVKKIIPDLEKIRLNQELTTIICNMVENIYYKRKITSIDKKNLVIEILNELFTLSTEESKTIEQQIQFAFDNNLIYKITALQRIWGNIKRTFFWRY